MLFRRQTIRILGTTGQEFFYGFSPLPSAPWLFWFSVTYILSPGSQVPSRQSTSNVRHSASSPKDPTLQGCPGLSLLTAWRSSVSFSQQWTDVAAAWKCRQGSPGTNAALPGPRPTLWTALLFLGQLSELSLDSVAIASVVPTG